MVPFFILMKDFSKMIEVVERFVRKVYCDLDHTLLDTAKLRELMIHLVGVNGWKYRQLELEAIGRGIFTMEAVSHRFAEELG